MSSAINLKKLKVYCDGASRGNPGQAGAGVFIEGVSSNEQVVCEKQLSIFLGTKTNNEAEYLALLAALKLILQIKEDLFKNNHSEACELLIFMDSMLVVQQMTKKWKIKEARMKKLAEKCRALLEKIDWTVKFEHVGRDLNSQADQLANLAMDVGSDL